MRRKKLVNGGARSGEIPAGQMLIRPRSPFVDFFRKPRGGAHAGREKILERVQRKEFRDAGKDWF